MADRSSAITRRGWLLGAAACAVSMPAHAEILKRKRGQFGELMVSTKGDVIYLKQDGQVLSAYDPTYPNRLVFPYLELLNAGTKLLPEPGPVLVVGLGGGALSRVLVQRGHKVVGVEVDRKVVRLGKKFLAMPRKVKVKIADGRDILDAKRGSYSCVVLDASTAEYIPPQLLTKECFEAVERHLEPGGVALMNSWTNAKRADDELATWRAVFPNSWVLTHPEDPFENRVLLGLLDDSDPRAALRKHMQKAVVRPMPTTGGRIRRDP